MTLDSKKNGSLHILFNNNKNLDDGTCAKNGIRNKKLEVDKVVN